MLFPLRAALVVGTIFYLSPVRPPFSLTGARDVVPADAATAAAGRLAAALPEGARAGVRAGAESLLTQALLRAGLDGERAPAPPAPPSRDTLHDGDRAAPWHGPPAPRRDPAR